MGSGALSGRLALVTGAGMGIGQGIALELARQGADVAIHYSHSEAGARETVAEIQNAGGEAVAIQGNLREGGACRQVVDAAAHFLGRLDILVHNSRGSRAGEFSSSSPATHVEG